MLTLTCLLNLARTQLGKNYHAAIILRIYLHTDTSMRPGSGRTDRKAVCQDILLMLDINMNFHVEIWGI